MTQFSKSVLFAAICLLLAVSGGCSSHTASVAPPPARTTPALSASNPTPATNGYPRPAQDLSSFDPQTEAAKIGIQLYPGATVYSSPYSVRRGNSYTQHSFFMTVDSPQQVSEFYDSIYSGSNFTSDANGNLFALISPSPAKDFYRFDLQKARDGNTEIQVTRIHNCENMYPKPCDSTGDPAAITP